MKTMTVANVFEEVRCRPNNWEVLVDGKPLTEDRLTFRKPVPASVDLGMNIRASRDSPFIVLDYCAGSGYPIAISREMLIQLNEYADQVWPKPAAKQNQPDNSAKVQGFFGLGSSGSSGISNG